MTKSRHVWPSIHNAMWPGLVGKGPDSEPPIDLDTMLDLTAAAATNGARFDGVDLFLFDPHVSIDASDDELKRLRDRIAKHDFVVGSLVAPVWRPTGGGAAMGSADDRKYFVTQVRKACVIGQKLNDLGIRSYGVVRIDSASSPSEWAKDPLGNTKKIAQTFREACTSRMRTAKNSPPRGNCWGTASWKRMTELLEMVNRPKTLGFQADMRTRCSHDGLQRARILLPEGYDWKDPDQLQAR